MKTTLFLGFFTCLVIVVNSNSACFNVYFLPQAKTKPKSDDQQPNFQKSSVCLYKYKPPGGSNIDKNYLRFTMSGYMYNSWLLLLKELTAKPSAAQKLKFYRLWTGLVGLENQTERDLWEPVADSLPEIYQNFSSRYNPVISLKNTLEDFFTSEDGFLKFFLTFVGQYRANNFFPMGPTYNEYSLQHDCRSQGCIFQIPIIPDRTIANSYDVGPTINILPDTSKNTYLKNFWRYVTIQNGAVIRNIWPVVGVRATPVPGEGVTVQQVLSEIVTSIKKIFNTLGMTIPRITIPAQYYDFAIPHYNPQEHGRIIALEIGFDYWASRFATYPYQDQLKIGLVYQEPQ